MARPVAPLEVRRRKGRSRDTDSGGRPLPEVVAVLPMAVGVPVPPADLGLEGRGLWERAWSEAITWLSPDSDLLAIVEACRAADDVAAARCRYRVTTDPADGRMVVTASKRLSEALSAIGFDPTARARLGVAEVKRVSALEQLLQQRRERG